MTEIIISILKGVVSGFSRFFCSVSVFSFSSRNISTSALQKISLQKFAIQPVPSVEGKEIGCMGVVPSPNLHPQFQLQGGRGGEKCEGKVHTIKRNLNRQREQLTGKTQIPA